MLRLEQNGRHFACDIFFTVSVTIWIQIAMKSDTQSPAGNVIIGSGNDMATDSDEALSQQRMV